MDKKDFASVVHILSKRYYEKERKAEPFEILVHGILSTRTKDTTTFPAQKRLLAVAGTPDKILKLKTDDIERLIYPVGFYRTKARLLKRACRFLIINFNSRVPKDKKELMKIPGAGAKVASLVLEWGFNLPYIAVDTHVNRISQRLGAVPFNTKPEQAEKILEEMLDKKNRMAVNHVFVKFGREICKPISPLCGECPVYAYCGFKLKSEYAGRAKSKKARG